MTDIKRDSYGRPYVIPPDGGKPKPYTRCTTLVKALDDTYNLRLWLQRMTAIGMGKRPDLVLAAQTLDPDTDKSRLNAIVDTATEVAGAGASATAGTAMHKLTELVDQGEELPEGLSESVLADLDAYTSVTRAFEIHDIETFVVVDELETAGTFDRLAGLGGKNYITDIKTGKTMEWGFDTIEAQLAVYSRGQRYDPEDGSRTDLDVDQDTGIVIHLPLGRKQAVLYTADLNRGWEGAKLAKAARDWRGYRRLNVFEEGVAEAIAVSESHTEIESIYRATPSDLWTDGLTDSASERKSQLLQEVAA